MAGRVFIHLCRLLVEILPEHVTTALPSKAERIKVENLEEEEVRGQDEDKRHLIYQKFKIEVLSSIRILVRF